MNGSFRLTPSRLALLLAGLALLGLQAGCKSTYEDEFSIQFVRDGAAADYDDPSIPIVLLLTDSRENYNYPEEFAAGKEITKEQIEKWFREDDIVKQTLRPLGRMQKLNFIPTQAAALQDGPNYGVKFKVLFGDDALDDLGKNKGGAIFVVANFSAKNASEHRTIIPLEGSEITSWLIVVKSSNSLAKRPAAPAE
jgi:hypothetical protein